MRAGLGVVATAGFLLAASAAVAEPSVQEQRRRAEAILTQVQELDAEVGAAAERFNGARYELGLLSSKLRSTRAALVRTRRDLGTARRRASRRLVELYTSGGAPSTLEIVLGAASMADAVDALETNRRVFAQDGRIAGELKGVAATVRNRERQLTVAQERQRRLVARLGSERAVIAARLRERQQLLGSIRAEVERLEAEERARQVELRGRAEAELARQRESAAAQAARAPEREPEAETAPQAAVEAPPAPPAQVAPPAPEPTPPPAPPADAGRGAQVVAIAMRYLGVPYKWGGASPSTGFDCSGLTMYVFAQIGVALPHYAAAQYQLGRPVAKSELAPGDLVFFRGLGHMGMYIGGGNFIHAPRTGDVVKISSIFEPYRVENWVGARRIL